MTFDIIVFNSLRSKYFAFIKKTKKKNKNKKKKNKKNYSKD